MATKKSAAEQFLCVDCTVELRDVKLLKLHYWKVHIPKREIFNFMKPTDKIKISSTGETTTVKKPVVSNRKRKLTDSRSASKSQAKRRNETQLDDSLNDVDTLDSSQRPDVVDSLSSDQIRTFNFKNIDEVELFERFKSSNAARNRNFKEGQIVWAYYRSRIWPACLAKLIKNKNGSINRIAVRYFEHNSNKSAIFKLDPLKVTAFFNPVETHIQYKQTGAEDMARRLEFLSCYSDALSEFCASLDMEAPTDEPEAKKATNVLDKQESETYFVLDTIMTKEDIVKVAEKELISESQQKTINKREEYSQRLMKVLKSEECQDYIVSILTNTITCKRQQAYLSGTVKDRKEMNFCSPGPLMIDHQKELAQNLEQLQIAHFPTKPAHLTSFTYDVIYPEAVIWAIKRMEKCTLTKAVSTYKAGFRQTSEEAIKQKCNELLAEWSNQENNNRLAESSVNSTDSIENESSLSLNNADMSDISASVADAIDLIVERIEKQHFGDFGLPEF